MFKMFEKSDGIIKAKLTADEQKTMLKCIKTGCELSTVIGALIGASLAFFSVFVLMALGVV